MSGNTFRSSLGIQLMWRSELFSRSFERSHFNIYPLIFLNLGQTLYLSSLFQQHLKTKVVMTAEFRCWTEGALPDDLLKEKQKKWWLIFQLYLSHFNRTPLNINFSRGCEFYICFTNIWFIHNSSAMLSWPKESWPLKVYWIPICLAEYPSYEPGRFENHEYNRTQE